MSERIRGSYDDALYKSTYTLLYYYIIIILGCVRIVIQIGVHVALAEVFHV